jgi:phage recombination protein Bet
VGQDIVKAEPKGIEAWESKTDLIKQTVAKGATNNELELFLYTCNRTGLDPLAKQIYAIKRKSKQGDQWVDTMTIQTGIDGYRLIAERTGKYEGQEGPFWCGPDGEWKDVWLKKEPPAAAKIGVLKAGFLSPLWGVARFDAYKQTRFDKESKQEVLMGLWAKMPDVMIAKVAEALALRRAFPQDLSGIYTSEEMQQADNTEVPEPSRTPEPAQRPTPTRQPVKTPPEAKSEDVMCSQCQGINGHTADCPTKQPKPQAEPTVLPPDDGKQMKGWMFVDKVTDRKTKEIPAKDGKPASGGTPYQVWDVTSRNSSQKYSLNVFHGTLRKNSKLVLQNWIEGEVKSTVKGDKTLYSLDKVTAHEDSTGITKWVDNEPVPDDPNEGGVPWDGDGEEVAP